MMKHNIFRTCILGAAAALALLASGCSNLFDTKSSDTSASDGKASITFSCSTPARTALPTVDFSTAGYTFTLTGTLSGTEQTLFTKAAYADLTVAGSKTLDAGSWTFVLTAYNTSDAAVLADTETVELHPGINAVAFVMSGVSGGTGSVTITLKYPTEKGVTKVTAQRYDTPAGADSVGFSGTGLAITAASGSETTDSVTYTESNVPSGNSGWVRFYLYNESGALIGSTTEGVAVVTGLESTSTIKLETINTYAAAVTLKKDGNLWKDSGKCVVVRETTDNLAYTLTDSTASGTFTGSVVAGVYDVYTGTDKDTALASTAAATDKTVGLDSSEVTLLFYSVTCSGTGITFTPATGSENPVLSGNNYSFTAVVDTVNYSGTPVLTLADGTTLTATDGVYTISNITNAQTVTVTGLTVYAPVFSVPAGNYNATQTVTITTQTEGATIYYTTDGTEPTVSSSVYSAPVEIALSKESSATLKAVAVSSSRTTSVTTAVYTFYYYWYLKDTTASTFSIETVRSLQQLANLVNKEDTDTTGLSAAVDFSGKTVQLANDLDLSSVCSATLGSWTPIGKYDSATSTSYSFEGTFDGNSKKVSNLYINSTASYQGLLGTAYTVKNLTVSGSVTGGDYTGGIAGSIRTEISGCTNNADISGGDETGGIAGFVQQSFECVNTGSVTGTGYTGGIAGSTGMSKYTYGCANTGTITGATAGGICGGASTNTHVYICFNKGSVSGTTASGGIAGKMNPSAYVCNCYNASSAVSGACAGAIIGTHYTTSPTYMDKCYYIATASLKGIGQDNADTNSYYAYGTYNLVTTSVADISALNDAVDNLNSGRDTKYSYVFRRSANTSADLPVIVVPVSCTVTFDANGGTGTMSSETFTEGTTKTLTANAFTRTGYTFLGWSLSNNAAAATWADGASVTMTGDATLYAVWKTAG